MLPYLSETLPTAAEVTSMAPSVTPNRTGVRIHRRCRINARCRIDRIFINHHWRRRYNDRPANHDGLGNDGSRLLDNDRRRTSGTRTGELPAHSLELRYSGVTGRSAATAGEARASALAAPKIALRMDVVPFFVSLLSHCGEQTREPIVRSTTGSRLSRRLIERSSIFGTCGWLPLFNLGLGWNLPRTNDRALLFVRHIYAVGLQVAPTDSPQP